MVGKIIRLKGYKQVVKEEGYIPSRYSTIAVGVTFENKRSITREMIPFFGKEVEIINNPAISVYDYTVSPINYNISFYIVDSWIDNLDREIDGLFENILD